MRSNIGRGLVFHVNELERLGGVRPGLARRLPLSSRVRGQSCSPARRSCEGRCNHPHPRRRGSPINEARQNHRGAGRIGPRVALLRAARVGTEPPGTSSRYSTLIKRPAKGGPPHRRATGGGPVVSRDRGTLTGLGEEAAPASVVPRHAQAISSGTVMRGRSRWPTAARRRAVFPPTSPRANRRAPGRRAGATPRRATCRSRASSNRPCDPTPTTRDA